MPTNRLDVDQPHPQPKPRKISKALLPVLFLLIGASAFAYLSKSKTQHTAPIAKEKVWQVQVQVLQTETRSPELEIRGSVEAPSRYRASASAAGWVESITVREGDHVTQGDILLQLDPRDFNTAIIQAEADLADIEAQKSEAGIIHKQNQSALLEERHLLKLTEKSLARSTRLKQQSLSSESALEEAQKSHKKQQLAVNQRELSVNTYQSKLQQLQARQKHRHARLDEAKRALRRSTVLAPYAGVVSVVEVANGERVNAGQNLLTLYAPTQLELRAFIPSQHLSELELALNKQTILLATERDHSSNFKLVRLSGNAKPGGIDAFFQPQDPLPRNQGRQLKLGELLTLNLLRPAQSNVFAIPAAAIYDNSRVYLLRNERLFGTQITLIGQAHNSDGRTVRLVRGEALSDGEQLVLTRLPNATSGLKAAALTVGN